MHSVGPLADRPRIAIIGAGAVGGYYGGRLVQGGHDVHFLLRSDFDAVRRHGLLIKSWVGDFELSPDGLNIYRDPRDMPNADWVIVTLKTTHNDQLESLISPILKPDSAILTLQNGMGNEERLASLFGAQRILGGMAFTCINRVAPGRIEHIAHGHIRLGHFNGGPGERASHIAALFNDCKVACDVLADLRYGRWEKLVWNVPFNGLSTVLDQTTDLLLATPEGEALVRRIMAEVIASARACGVPLGDELIDINVERTLNMGAYRTSMHIDRQLGRDLEVEAILGEPARAGAAAGAVNPCMQTLYAMARMVARAAINVSDNAADRAEPRTHPARGST
jgi:2-dehydropantoate 2-reductase